MRLAALLLVICGGLALAVVYERRGPPEPSPANTSKIQGTGASASEPLPEIKYRERGVYGRVVTLNLFSPDRQPGADDGQNAAASPKRPAGLPRFSLKGVVITPEGRSALIKFPRERDYRKVVKGEVIEGWILQSIAADSVTVKKEGTSTVVRLRAPKPAKPRGTRRQGTRRPRPKR